MVLDTIKGDRKRRLYSQCLEFIIAVPEHTLSFNDDTIARHKEVRYGVQRDVKCQLGWLIQRVLWQRVHHVLLKVTFESASIHVTPRIF